MTTRVAVIGVGSMGYHHARNFSQMNDVELVAVADVDEAHGVQVAEGYSCRFYPGHELLLEREQLDAVSIAVPTRLHLPVCLDVLAAGVPVLVEKPLAGTVDEAERLSAKSAETGVPIAVGHIERFNPAVRELKARLDAGDLGTVTSIIAKRVGVMPPRIKDANVIVDLAVHDVDVINYLLGALPTGVEATAGQVLLSDRLDHGELFLKYGQVGCFIIVNWITPIKVRTLSVTGNSGHAELDYVTQTLDVYESNLERSYDDFGDFVVRFGTPRKTSAPIPVEEPLKLELEAFVRSVRDETPFPVTPQDGTDALRVVERILESVSTTDAGGAR